MGVVRQSKVFMSGLGARLFLLTGFPLAAFVIVSVFVITAQSRVTTRANQLTHEAIPTAFALDDLQSAVAEAMQLTSNAASESDPHARNTILKLAREKSQRMADAQKRLADHEQSLGESSLEGANVIVRDAPIVRELSSSLIAAVEPVWTKLAQNTVLATDDALFALNENVKPIDRQMLGMFAALDTAKKSVLADADATLNRNLASMRSLLFVGPLIAIVLTVPIALVLATRLRNRLAHIGQVLGEIRTDWNLGRRIDDHRSDEIGTMASACDALVNMLETIIKDVRVASVDVASASTQIAASSEELSVGMQNQQRQSGQVSSAVEEMSASVAKVAKKANEAANAAIEGGDQAQEGGDIVTRTVEGMEIINREVTESAEAVGDLGKRGEQIGNVIAVINDIADQTNLLALNAAIEAARAGEHGRGFAVVADEVRKLAERTTQATEEVAESIKAIQDETSRAVERMQSGTSRVDEGVSLARQAGSALTSIVESSQGVAAMIQSIAAAAEQQSNASGEISRNVEQINAVTSESAQGVQQAAAAATQLSEKAEQLQSLVGRFRLGE